MQDTTNTEVATAKTVQRQFEMCEELFRPFSLYHELCSSVVPNLCLTYPHSESDKFEDPFINTRGVPYCTVHDILL